ncbi:MAG: hypothetical protein AAF844_12555 [Pseudomonadota bacterium]
MRTLYLDAAKALRLEACAAGIAASEPRRVTAYLSHSGDMPLPIRRIAAIEGNARGNLRYRTPIQSVAGDGRAPRLVSPASRG